MTGKDRAASLIRDGWIWVPPPAAPYGWYRVIDVSNDGGWTTFKLDGRLPYVVLGGFDVFWSSTSPVPVER